MAVIFLPLPTQDTPRYTYTIGLSSQDYELKFEYMTRNEAWYLSILNTAGELLISNIRLAPHYALLAQYPQSYLPEGDLILQSSSEYESPPKITLENLSTDFLLAYITED